MASDNSLWVNNLDTGTMIEIPTIKKDGSAGTPRHRIHPPAGQPGIRLRSRKLDPVPLAAPPLDPDDPNPNVVKVEVGIPGMRLPQFTQPKGKP